VADPFSQDFQSPGGEIPQETDGIIGGQQEGGGGVLGELLRRLASFIRNHFFYTVPKPFDFMRVEEVLVPLNTDVWLDQFSKQPRRRAWAVINTDPVLGNNCWVNTVAMGAAGQGGRVLAQGGSASIPGSERMDVHVFTNVVAGVTVCFYQFG
jgi:hypothetical protein